MRKKKERNQNNYDGNKFKAMNMENPKWEDMSKFDKKNRKFSYFTIIVVNFLKPAGCS